MKKNVDQTDEFELYDLKVVVESIEGNCTCNMAIGDYFFLKGGKISLPNERDFCLMPCSPPFLYYLPNSVNAIPQTG